MNRAEIIADFRQQNPELTENRVPDTVLHSFCKEGNKNVCARTRCIADEDGTVIETNENDRRFDLTVKISKFYDLDTSPGSGVLYNDKRLKITTMAMLDNDSLSWRNRTAGTPEEYYRRGKWLCLDRPIGSAADDLKVYCILIPDDFDDDNKSPYNGLSYLEPFHGAIVKYLEWKAKAKVLKPEDGLRAKGEYDAYIEYMRKMIGGTKFGPIRFQPR